MRRILRIFRRWLLLLFVFVLIALGGFVVYTMVQFSQSYQRDTQSLQGAELGIQKQPSGVTNIALFGVDADNENTRRADCIMILSLDYRHNQVKLTSLMRDSRVEIPAHGEAKLNHAYSYGGPALAIRTINETFDLNIAHYIQVDFSQLANMIGALGGIYIDVKENEIRELNKFIGEYCRAAHAEECPVTQAGPQLLNGIQAMSYGRIRKGGTGDDWGRVARQSAILEAMFARVQSLSAMELYAVAPKMLKYMTTDLSVPQLVGMSARLLIGGMPQITHGRIPVDGAWNYGGSHSQYIVFDLDEAAHDLHQFLYEDIPLTPR